MKRRNIAIISSVVIVLIVAIVICFIPLIQVSYSVDERYQATETYPVQVDKPLNYRETRAYNGEKWNLSLGAYAECSVSIENIDTVPGTFVVDFTFTTLRRTFSDSDRAYILPGEVTTLKGLADIAMGEDWTWSRKITPATKTITETREREVWKTRPVMRYKKITMLEYLTSY